MKAKNKSTSGLLIFLCAVLSVLIALASVEICLSSFVSVKTENEESRVFVSYFDRVYNSYEDSSMFEKRVSNTVADITRMCVIRNQVETNGKYDAQKKIDITKFANRTKAIDSTGASAEYRLDDLIKWGNYGYDYQAITGTSAQLDAYFYALQNGDVKLGNTTTDTIHVEEYLDSMSINELVEDSMTASEEYEANANDDTDTMYVLVERYNTVGGKSLISYASNRSEYEGLVKNLCASADSLFSNYMEYTNYLETYGAGSNLLYCMQLTDSEGKLTRYSNLEKDTTILSNDELSKQFTAKQKYICFNPDKLQIATNIDGINAIFMKQTISNYEYAFKDGSRIWIALDTSYPCADIFLAEKNAYDAGSQFFIPSVIVVVVSFVLLIILIILLSIQAGRATRTDKDGNEELIYIPKKIDSIPFELYLILLGVVGFLLVCMVGLSMSSLVFDATHSVDELVLFIIFGVEAAICALIGIPMYLILVRKIKCHLMWNGSILRFVCKKIRDAAIDVYDNGQLITRTWLPYLLFLSLNLVLVLLGLGGILVALVIDIIVGVWQYKETKTREAIVDGITEISDGDISHQIDTNGMHGDNLALANAVNSIGDGIRIAVETSMRDEKMKADLITNVSHDIKTPLTSIINFVDLLKRENIQDEKIRGYIDVLDQKSQRLKALTNDLVEASKISSGNISLNIEKINLVELINQTVAEFDEKFEEKGLAPVIRKPSEPAYIMADGRGIYRVVENLYNNIYKYALENTRVYIDMDNADGVVTLAIKNISAKPLDIDGSELTERFIRGDESRKTEGSGLGLSIAKSLTLAMNGTFDVMLDGDLFKVVITFALA